MHQTKKVFGPVAAGLLLLTSPIANGALLPVDLRCEQRVNPLGIGDVLPRLAWRVASTSPETLRGETQSAYQIRVGTAAGLADVWDSGKVASAATVDIGYGGLPLTSGKKYFWQVRVYDGDDNVSGWSTNGIWSMGLLSTNDWVAQWIGYDAAYNLSAQEISANSLFNTSGLSWVSAQGQSAQSGIHQSILRKRILLPGGAITNAVMTLHADNRCHVYVNGQLLTNSALRWEATARINVTPWLQSGGTNVVVLAATSDDAQRPATAIGRLVVQYNSGSVTTVPVDTSWKAAAWPTGNWTTTNYDDSSWGTPAAGGSPWGTPARNDSARIPAPYLRKMFSVGPAVNRATVYVTALGAYELRLNGQKVGNDVLTPGWTEFRKRVYYQTYDVTGLVQSGANTLAMLLGDGWFASNLGFNGQRLNYGGKPRLRAQLVLELANGTTQTIATDSSWKASYGPIRFGDLLLGSEYDARLEMPNWDRTNFNDSAWSPVVVGLDLASLKYTNVTTLVTSQITGNQLNFPVNNTTMGGDPVPNTAKVLQIIYRIGGGTNQTQTFAENSTAILNGGGQALMIVEALYGDSVSISNPGGPQVQAAVTEPSRPMETLPAINFTQPKPGRYTFDLGQNMVGWVRLNITGSVGDRITVRHGEMLNPDGTVYVANLRGANSTDFYTFGTNGAVVYEPRFTFHGFRYVEITGLSVPPTINSVTGIVVNSEMRRTGDFACSSPLVNQLFHNIIWGQKGNYLEVPTDCPQRDERLGWTGDAEFFVPTAAYNFDVQNFFRRWLVALCDDSQFADGSYANVAPDLGAGGRAAAWQDAAWICTHTMYLSYGDTNLIAAHYESFKKLGNFLASYSSGYSINSLPGDFGDWVNLGGGATGRVIDTAFYAYYAQAMAEMSTALGKTVEAAAYATLRNNIAAAFATFFNQDGTFAESGNSQTAYALAFTLGLVPDNLRSQVTQKFANTIAAFGNHLATGFIGTPRLLPALHLAGRDDLAYTLLLQETYPSWLFQVNLGATTMWERWDGWTPGGGFQTIGMNSFNHYSFGAVGEYLYGNVGGIRPGSPGYKTVRIQPVPGKGLTWAKTRLDSVRGNITTAWTNSSGIFTLKTEVPPNTTAQIFVPTTNALSITESGMPATNSPGVTYLGTTNNHAVFSVGSGHYQWSSAYAIPEPPGVVITATNQTGMTVPFTPSWGLVTNGSLLAGKLPTSSTGSFNQESQLGNRSVNSLTTGGSLQILTSGSPTTTSSNYVTCGNNGGTSATYTLTGSTNGYDLTNIVVYGGWGDNGRDQQAYTIYYSTMAAPTNFMSLATVNYNPAIGSGIPSATRISITYSTGVLAQNVAALKFDFSTPSSENGYCGYTELTAFGSPSLPPPSLPGLWTNTQPVTASMMVGDQVSFTAAFGGDGPLTYQWQKIGSGNTNNLPGETNLTLTLVNLQASDAGSYRLVASNLAGVTASAPAALTVSSMPVPVNNIITRTAHQTGLGGNTFYPTWSVETHGSLIAAIAPDTATGDFSREIVGRDVGKLTLDHDLGLKLVSGSPGFPVTTTSNYVTCGNGNGAGSSLIYALPNSTNGYNLTNITVYGGWADTGRDQQAYSVSYATVNNPGNFIPLTSINFNPTVGGAIQSATRISLLSVTGTLATNVAALQFDFTAPSSENGYCGYAGIAVFGSPTVPPVVPTTMSAVMLGNDNFRLDVTGLVAGRNYQIQSSTNLASSIWQTETNFVATQASFFLTISTLFPGQRFFRTVGY
ncbi:MAG: family 78 glycoside hydrolase catalytic domain [Verrucomicrobiota bacterium]